MHGFESVVGPVKGVFDKETSLNKAREHSLLRSDRPAYVTILSLGNIDSKLYTYLFEYFSHTSKGHTIITECKNASRLSFMLTLPLVCYQYGTQLPDCPMVKAPELRSASC